MNVCSEDTTGEEDIGFKYAECYFVHMLEAALHKIAVVRPFTIHLTNHHRENDLDLPVTSWKVRLLSMDTPVLSELQKLIFLSSVQKLGGCRLEDFTRTTTDKDGWWEKGSRESLLLARIDDH